MRKGGDGLLYGLLGSVDEENECSDEDEDEDEDEEGMMGTTYKFGGKDRGFNIHLAGTITPRLLNSGEWLVGFQGTRRHPPIREHQQGLVLIWPSCEGQAVGFGRLCTATLLRERLYYRTYPTHRGTSTSESLYGHLPR